MKTIGIIGGGNMGMAIVSRIVGQFKILVCEKDKKKQISLKKKFRVSIRDLEPLVRDTDIIILAVKPQDMEKVLAEIKGAVKKNQVVISIAAGITTVFIEKRLGSGVRIIRTMPNMPAQIAEGITAVCKGKYATAADVSLARKIFNNVGKTVVVKENLIDAVTAVSGSGPAYVFLFVECFIEAAESLGLNKKLSRVLVQETLRGSAHLLAGQKEDPAVLRAKVTSKGGTTQAAMDVFMKNKINKIYKQALAAAEKRAKALSRG